MFPNPQSVNRAIKRIIADYNEGEEVASKKQHRNAVLLPAFSAHNLRHTFCTRLCEKETNLKVIQSVMGHKDIQTTMDIYAEATEQKKQESFERLAATLDVFLISEEVLLLSISSDSKNSPRTAN